MNFESLKGKKDDPFWKEVFNGSYESLSQQIDMVKGEIDKNRFEMKQMVNSHLSDYVKSEEAAIKLTEEVSKILKANKGSILKATISKVQRQKVENNTSQEKAKDKELGLVILPTTSVFSKFRRCIQESDFMDIFEVERVIQQCLKAEEYEELGRLLFWLERLILKNSDNACLFRVFGDIMNKYRRVLCNTLFMGYQKSKKEKLKKFFIDFGRNLHSSKDAYLFEIFQAHFLRKFKQVFDKRKTQLVQTNHVSNVLEVYGKALSKSMRFIQHINEHLREVEQGRILQFINKFRRSLVDLVDKLRPAKLNEIKTRVALYQEPLKTQLYMGAVPQFQISCHKNMLLQKIKAFLRYQRNGTFIFDSIALENEVNQTNFNQIITQSEGLKVIASIVKAFCYLLDLNKVESQKKKSCMETFINSVKEECDIVEHIITGEDLRSQKRNAYFKALQFYISII